MATPTLISLETLRTDYSVFERDQVLTEAQLNSVAQYFDEQERLTRVELSGVGIIAGLRAIISDEKILIGRGLGISTDGDLLMLQDDAEFDSVKPYDENAPFYAPFYEGGEKIMPIWELVRTGESDVKKEPFTSLPMKLGNFAIVIYMESYQQDHDLCSAADCDNLGVMANNNLRLLLVPLDNIKSLLDVAMHSASSSSKLLVPVLAERPRLSDAIQSTTLLANLYRTAADNTHIRIRDSLPGLWSALPGLLIEQFGSNPVTAWQQQLDIFENQFDSRNDGIQYYYDFLKDVAEAWNELLDCLFDNNSVLCPDFAAFPKHLVLGELAPAQGRIPTWRTGFYPSPVADYDQRQRACALVTRLDSMIMSAQFPLPSTTPIRITPSRDERAPLEARAIPFYYAQNPAHPILPTWSPRLSARKLERCVQAYNYSSYVSTSQRTPRQPYNTQVGAYDFFRIEGHFGQKLDTVMQFLKTEILNQNLPITLHAVMVNSAKTGLTFRPPRYTDLQRFSHLLRKDVLVQLDTTKTFSDQYRSKVKSAATAKTIPAQIAGKPAAQYADEQHTAIMQTANNASPALQKNSYTEYRQAAQVGGATWLTNYNTAVQNASKFRVDVDDMVRTTYINPFDNLVNSHQSYWVNWMDILIDNKNNQEDDKLLLHNFFKLHPGLEHFAGVSRGGTFVLVYDSNQNVVADFMMPYALQTVAEEEAPEPDLPTPGYFYPGIIDQGYKLPDFIDTRFQFELGNFEKYIQPKWQEQINIQRDYQTFFVESLGTLGDVLGKYTVNGGLTMGPGFTAEMPKTGDGLFDSMLGRVKYGQEEVERIMDIMAKGDLTQEEMGRANKVLEDAQTNLGRAVNVATDYMVESKIDVSAGKPAAGAVTVISNGTRAVTSDTVRTQMKTDFNTTLGKAGAGGYAGAVQNIMNFGGMQFGK